MTRNGFPEETWYDFAYSPVRDDAGKVVGLLNVTSESTARVNAQQERDRTAVELSTNDAKWRELFETLEEGFVLGKVIRDRAGRIVDWRYDEVNNAWYDLVGVERGCTVGRTVREVLPGIEDERVMEVARVVETGEAVRFARQVGDLQRWYDGVCQPAGADQFTVLFLEVTDRVQAERRSKALAELGRVLPNISDPDEVMRVASAIIGRTLGVGRVGYGTVAEGGETLTVPIDWTAEGYPSIAGTYRMDDYGGYTYDMGDDWRHTIVVDAVGPAEPDTKYPRFVAGERRCPPEDIGGFPGFELFLDVMSDPAHEEHQQLRQWHGGPFDFDDIDELATKHAVAAIAIRRHAGKAAYENSRVHH